MRSRGRDRERVERDEKIEKICVPDVAVASISSDLQQSKNQAKTNQRSASKNNASASVHVSVSAVGTNVSCLCREAHIVGVSASIY